MKTVYLKSFGTFFGEPPFWRLDAQSAQPTTDP